MPNLWNIDNCMEKWPPNEGIFSQNFLRGGPGVVSFLSQPHCSRVKTVRRILRFRRCLLWKLRTTRIQVWYLPKERWSYTYKTHSLHLPLYCTVFVNHEQEIYTSSFFCQWSDEVKHDRWLQFCNWYHVGYQSLGMIVLWLWTWIEPFFL